MVRYSRNPLFSKAKDLKSVLGKKKKCIQIYMQIKVTAFEINIFQNKTTKKKPKKQNLKTQ